MKVIVCFAVFLYGAACGRIVSPIDNYEGSQYDQDMDNVDNGTMVIFSNDDPYVTANVHYYLYTNEEEAPYEITKDDEELLKDSTFDPSKKTKVLIHGFTSSYQRPVEEELQAAYLGHQEVNVVAVDWKKLAEGPLYNRAAAYTLPVGQEVAQLMDFLVSAGGANVSDIHILGHSLGAHVAGFAANYVKSGRITRISGMDPAGPLFRSKPPSERLDPSDADIVDCIHTCGKLLGYFAPLGTHDFYPNGGKPIQPGCGLDWSGHCSHDRSFGLFASSIEGNLFTAQACSDFQEVKERSCSGEWTGLLGEPADTTSPGIYLLETTGYYPYAE